MSSHVDYGRAVTLEVRCSKCGRILGYYKGEIFWIDGLWKPSHVRIVCSKCRGGREKSKVKCPVCGKEVAMKFPNSLVQHINRAHGGYGKHLLKKGLPKEAEPG